MSPLVAELKRITGGSLECGWMCDEVADFVASLVRFYKPELVIQTGHLWGKSAAVILEALTSESGHDPVEGDKLFAQFVADRRPVANGKLISKLISIDPNPMGVPNWRAGVEFLKERFPNRFIFHNTTSTDFFSWPRPLTLVGMKQRLMGLVDGDHTDDGCAADIHALADRGAGVIIVDDVLWIPSLAKVARGIATRRGYDYQQHSIYNGIAVLVKA